MTAVVPIDPSYPRPLQQNAIGGDPKAALDELLRMTVLRGGSDLHLTAGIAPCIRVHGSLRPVEHHARLTPYDTEAMLRTIVSPEH
jgi:twitching motility protein PilT